MNPAYRTVVFAVGEPPPEKPFWIVTAWNPEGRPADGAANRKADADLLAALRRTGETPVRVTGMSPDRSHREPGWSVKDRETALSLARRFRQEAVYRIDRAGQLHLHETATGAEERLGRWHAARESNPRPPDP
ncbi:MAG: DUF3293 domain-containing protein [Puniceicoccaceae bacterium]